MRVFQIHNRYRLGGGEDTVVAQERAVLSAAGHTVDSLSVDNAGNLAATLVSLAVAPWNPSSFRRVASAIDEQPPDVAHIHNTWFQLSPSVTWALAKAQIPIVWTAHNFRVACSNAVLYRDGGPCYDCVGRGPWSGVRHRCYRDSLALSMVAAVTIATHQRLGTWRDLPKKIVAVTSYSRDLLIRAGLPAERIVVKSNFVGDPGERPFPPSSSNRVLFVGRLSKEKGLDVLLDAWRMARPSGLQLVLVGDAMNYPSGSWPPSVTFAGPLSHRDILELMLSSRFLVFPSISAEGQPMTLLEAMAAGLPVVASATGGVPETLGEAGLQLAPGVVEELAEVLAGVDDLLLDKISAAARERWKEHFSASVGLHNLEMLYAETAS